MIGAIAGTIAGSRFAGVPAAASGFTLFDPGCRFTDATRGRPAVDEADPRGGSRPNAPACARAGVDRPA